MMKGCRGKYAKFNVVSMVVKGTNNVAMVVDQDVVAETAEIIEQPNL